LEKDITPKGGAARQKIVIEVRVKIGNSIPYGGSMNRHILWRKLSLLVGLALAATLFLGGCGTDSYDQVGTYTPTLTATTNALIEPAQLKEWMDLGLVNAQADGSERVVILTVGTKTEYEIEHIPGALLWDSANSAGEPAFHQSRLEALAPVSTMVSDGASMDSLLRSRGIDGRTTIVISHSGGNMMNPSRAYFTLRYWGFPRERVKLLNGGNIGWKAAVTANEWDVDQYAATHVVPVAVPTSFSVRENGAINADLRLSLGEMLQEVDRNLADPTTTGYILDARGGTDYEATTIPTTYPMYSFQGRIANAIKDNHSAYYAASGFKALGEATDAVDAGTLWAQLNALGVSSDKKIITYCVSGMRAAVPFFVIDGILGWDVALYDGSWNQWGSYAEHFNMNTATPPAPTTLNANATPKDAWRTDLFNRSVNNSLNADPATVIAPRTTTVRNSTLVWDASRINAYTTNTDERANQIENDDARYMLPVPTAPAPPTAGGGGGASGC
jgi:3-mercaptopyruvate sulfurtransferase SseA